MSNLESSLAHFRDRFARLKSEVQKVIIGQDEILEATVIAMIAGGHVVLEGVPGLGKTLLVRSLAGALRLRFNRIQFTPDVTPSDVVGFSMYNRKTNEFEYKQGAVFCQFLLADEINRTNAKTQSSLLEVMGSGRLPSIRLPTAFRRRLSFSPPRIRQTTWGPSCSLRRSLTASSCAFH